jgi:hypothetical protein
LAIRGTVINGECKTDFAGESEIRLSQHYNDCKVKFINDVQGLAYGIHFKRDESQFVQLFNKDENKNEKNPMAPKILFTMGTGTGLSIIYPYKGDKVNPMILPSENWGSTLSPDPQSPI